MSKDPAFPFYTQDFLVGTLFFTDEEVGVYVRLLSVQHQHGGLIDKDVFNSKVANYPKVKAKFVEIEDGFYNERLMKEMGKRQIKSNNLSANALKRWESVKQKQCKSNAIALQKNMPTENENENEIEIETQNNTNKKKQQVFTPPTIEEASLYCQEKGYTNFNVEKFIDFYESKGWVVGKTKMKNWKAALSNAKSWCTIDIHNELASRIGKQVVDNMGSFKRFHEKMARNGSQPLQIEQTKGELIDVEP